MFKSIEQAIKGFNYEVDVRKSPDERSRVQFRMGWVDATKRQRTYRPSVLKQLSWRNAGYRLGVELGGASPEVVERAFRLLAGSYFRGVPSASSAFLSDWSPRTTEDHLLQQYHEQVGGWLYAEVQIGGAGGEGHWPDGSRIRRIDGVRLLQEDAGEPLALRFQPNQLLFLKELGSASEAEIIEVKPTLNRLVIGQVIAGADMFERQYTIMPKMVIVAGTGDAALEWVCQQRSIHVVIP